MLITFPLGFSLWHEDIICFKLFLSSLTKLLLAPQIQAIHPDFDTDNNL